MFSVPLHNPASQAPGVPVGHDLVGSYVYVELYS